MLWPSTTPATSVFAASDSSVAGSSCSGTEPRTRSRLSASIGAAASAGSASSREPYGRGDEDRRAVLGGAQRVVGDADRLDDAVALLVDALAHERGLVELHPLGARRRELGEEGRVHGDEVGEPVERTEALGGVIRRLRQQEEGDRARRAPDA